MTINIYPQSSWPHPLNAINPLDLDSTHVENPTLQILLISENSIDGGGTPRPRVKNNNLEEISNGRMLETASYIEGKRAWIGGVVGNGSRLDEVFSMRDP